MAVRIQTIIGTATLALALGTAAGCASTAPAYGGSYGAPSGGGYQNSCGNCGTVTNITVGGASGTSGALIGGLVGAVAGHEVSAQTGGSKGNQNMAAVAGAVAGAAAGKAIQDRVTGDTYNIHVRMDDGRTLVINQHDLRGIRENTYVRVVNGKAVLR